MEKIILFYKYVKLTYPHQVMKWQRQLCSQLGLKGRIVLATEGINGTLGGSVEACEIYKKEMEASEFFKNIDFKESEGGADCFPRLEIKVKKEITHLGLDTELYTAENGGIHLTPEEAHNLMANPPKDLIILDGRNNYEAAIGKFVNAITPDVNHFREFPNYIDNNLEQFKDKEVLMYCTGGIRCERASTYLKSKGVAKNVYQILGGIHRYAEKYPDGFFRGKNYVFDARVTVRINDDILGSCKFCNIPFDDYTNCVNSVCNKQIIVCPKCCQENINTCSAACAELVKNKSVVVRQKPKKINISACSI